MYFVVSGRAKTQFNLYIYPTGYDGIIEKYSDEYGVPREVICAVINTESSFEPDAVSAVGAKGLMQIMDDTNMWICEMSGMDESADIFEPEINIKRGTWLLSYLYRQFENWDVAFAAYNAGWGNVTKWLADERYSSDGKMLHTIPFKETRKYVERVNTAIFGYKELFNKQGSKEYQQ